MIVSTSISGCAKNIVHQGGRFQVQMCGNTVCVTSRGSSAASCFHFCSGKSKKDYVDLSISRTISCSSQTGSQMFLAGCFGSCGRTTRNLRSLTIRSFIGANQSQKRHLEMSLACRTMNMSLSVPKQGMLRKIKCNVGPMYWPQGCASVGLISGLLVCYSSSKPVHSQVANEKEDEEEDCDLSNVVYSHGKKLYTDYYVTGIPGDGRCLFRSVAHGACLRAGKPAPSESIQRELADDLRAKVADEFIKRREETEWFIEGDFDTYVLQMRKPYVWGGEPELLMASHVLRMPITVYMHDKDAGGLITIAEYGQEYGKENPIRVLYHGFGHYDALHFPGYKDGISKL